MLNKPWSCVLDAYCLVTDVPVDEYLKIIGHDGSEILSLSLDNQVRRGFSLDELSFAALHFGWHSTELVTVLTLQAARWATHYNAGRNLAKEYFDKHPNERYVMCTHNHAFGYRDGQVFDPAERIKELPDFDYLSTVYLIKKLV